MLTPEQKKLADVASVLANEEVETAAQKWFGNNVCPLDVASICMKLRSMSDEPVALTERDIGILETGIRGFNAMVMLWCGKRASEEDDEEEKRRVQEG